jgi:succinoglycan biosynthesis protein ExoA
MRRFPFVTVIVPVRDEARCIEATLRALFSQNYPPHRFEVIVVDGRSEDGTRAIVQRLQSEFFNLRLFDNPKRLSSAARNIGIRHARGEYLLVVDGHCEIRSRDYLRNLVEAFERHDVESVGRPQPLELTHATPLQRAIAAARRSRLGHNPGSFIYSDDGGYVPPQSVAIAYRRDVAEMLGGFDESFDACEDVEFNHRLAEAGGRCWFAPQLAIHYHPRGTLKGLAHQMQRYGRGRARLLMKHPRTLSLGPLVPAAFLAAVAVSLLLSAFSVWAAAVFGILAMAYGLAVVAAGLNLALRNREPKLAPLFPAVFAAIHFGAGWGVLKELCIRLVRRPTSQDESADPGRFADAHPPANSDRKAA